MSSDTPIQKKIFSERLWLAIKRQGLTYEQTARRAREHLPPGAKLSSVTVWSYAKGRSTPRRLSYVEALGKALGVDPDELMGEPPKTSAPPAEAEERAPEAAEAEMPRRPQEDEQLPAIHVADLGDGQAYLHIQEVVPWPVALEILQRLKGDQSGDFAADGAEPAQEPLPEEDEGEG